MNAGGTIALSVTSVSGRALNPLVDLAGLAVPLGIVPYAPSDAADLAALRELFASRTAPYFDNTHRSPTSGC